MSELKHATGTTPETDEQTEARLATLTTVETTSTTDAATDDTATDTTAETVTDGQMPTWLLPDKVYQVLKWLTLTVLPALAVLVGALGHVWNIPNTEAIMTTISAVALFFGATIGVSAISAKTV